MSKVISKEEALDTLVRLARMKDKEFDITRKASELSRQYKEALKITIEALNQAPVLDKDIEKLFSALQEVEIEVLSRNERGFETIYADISELDEVLAIKQALQSISITSDE